MNIRKRVYLLTILVIISLVANYYLDTYLRLVKTTAIYKQFQKSTFQNQYNVTKILTHLNKINYFRGRKVSTPSSDSVCKLKILDPWNEDAKRLTNKTKPFECRKDSPLTFVHEKRLFINQTINTSYYSGAIAECQVAKVFLDGSLSNLYSLGKFQKFENGLKIIDDVIIVRCWNTSNILDYEYVHYVFHRYKKNKDESKYKERMNVLVLLFDSVSSSAFQRALPKSYEFLKSFSTFYHFKKLHVVGSSTIYNFIPLVSGHHYIQRSDFANNDNFTYIWRNYSSQNYTTYFQVEWNREDEFSKKPTDHYFQYFWNKAYGTKSLPFVPTESVNPCYYDKLIHNVNMDLMRSFFKENFPKNESSDFVHQNFFMISFFVEMSHDHLDRLFLMDDDFLEFLKETLTPSFLESTLLIIMGDHGHRHHPIRKTFTGKLEQSLPFLGCLVPSRLKKNNELLHQILTQNTNTMITPYDVYETLLHLVLDQTDIHSTESNYLKDRTTRRSSNNGFSLFLPLPDRDCFQAQIPIDMCVCELEEQIKKPTEAQIKTYEKATKFIIGEINEVILENLVPSICVRYELKEIRKADYLTKDKISLIIETKPGIGIFEATLLMKMSEEFEVLDYKIQRLSIYGKTSKCVKDAYLKEFCYCASNI